MKIKIPILMFLVVFGCTSFAATERALCKLTAKDGKVLQYVLQIDREEHSPVGYGALDVGGLKVSYESGFGGVDDNGGTDKYVFQNFTVSRRGKTEFQIDLGESGQRFSAKLNDPVFPRIACRL